MIMMMMMMGAIRGNIARYRNSLYIYYLAPLLCARAARLLALKLTLVKHGGDTFMGPNKSLAASSNGGGGSQSRYFVCLAHNEVHTGQRMSPAMADINIRAWQYCNRAQCWPLALLASLRSLARSKVAR